MVAAEHGYDAIIGYLLDSGANINAVDKNGDTALDIAKYHERTDTIELLLLRGGIGAEGPSAKERMMDSYYEACDHANAVKKLLSEIAKLGVFRVYYHFRYQHAFPAWWHATLGDKDNEGYQHS